MVFLIISFEARDVVCNALCASLSKLAIHQLLPLAIFKRLVLLFVLEEDPIEPLMLLFIEEKKTRIKLQQTT